MRPPRFTCTCTKGVASSGPLIQATQQPSNQETPCQPSLRGSVVASYRHYKGKKLGPYFYRKSRRTFKQYIRPEDLERVRAACQAHREKAKEDREGVRQIYTFIDNCKFMAKHIFNWEKGIDSSPEEYAYLDRLNKEGMYITGRPLYRPRRLFGDPSVSKLFLDCLKRTKDLALTRFMVTYKIHPDDVDADLSPTDDPEKNKARFNALFNHMLNRKRTPSMSSATARNLLGSLRLNSLPVTP